jgi:hypothetical protein
VCALVVAPFSLLISRNRLLSPSDMMVSGLFCGHWNRLLKTTFLCFDSLVFCFGLLMFLIQGRTKGNLHFKITIEATRVSENEGKVFEKSICCV